MPICSAQQRRCWRSRASRRSPFNAAEAALGVLDAGFRRPVVSDIRMPGMNGLQLFDRVKADRPRHARDPDDRTWRHRPWPSRRSRTAPTISSSSPIRADRLVEALSAGGGEAAAGAGEPRGCAKPPQQAADGLPLIGETPAIGGCARPCARSPTSMSTCSSRARRAPARRSSRSCCTSWSRRRSESFRRAELRRAARDRDRKRALRSRGRRLHRRAAAARSAASSMPSGGTLFLDEIECMPAGAAGQAAAGARDARA